MNRWITGKKIRCFLYFLFMVPFLLSVFTPYFSQAEEHRPLVYIIPIEDNIERGLQAFLERGFAEAKEAGAEHLLLEMNTFGGAVDAASGIGELLQQTQIPTTVFVRSKAISAGAYIALNADQIIMVPTSTMGAATVVDSEGNAGDAKAMSFWVEAMEEAAISSGRDPLYARAMVDLELEIEGLTTKGQPLTFGASKALEYGYAEAVLESRADVLEFLELEQAQIVELETSLAEKVARFVTNPIIVPILLSLGSLGLILELYSPGFGIPGAIGISALLLFFFGHMIAGFAGWESLILFGLGIILLAIELFIIPGFGIFGLLGIGAVIGGLALGSYDVVSGLRSLGIAILVTVVVMAILGKSLSKRGIWRKLVLQEELSNTEGQAHFHQRSDLLGLQGISTTQLRPAGTATIGGKRYDVVSDGSFIEKNRPVQVVFVEGTRIVVSEIE